MDKLKTLNPSPKQKLLADGAGCKAHSKLISDDSLRALLDVALAQFTRENVNSTFQDPAARWCRISGAHDFLSLFYNLSTPPQAPVQHKTGLDFKA